MMNDILFFAVYALMNMIIIMQQYDPDKFVVFDTIT